MSSMLRLLRRRRGTYRAGAVVSITFAIAVAAAAASTSGPTSEARTSTVPGTRTAALAAYRPCGRTRARPRHYRHVVVVLMENTSYRRIIHSRHAPFINRLARKCGLATRYHAVAHPSLPNYMALTSGSTRGVSGDCQPSRSCGTRRASIFSETRSWASYAESMPSPCLSHDSGRYVVKHNPPPYFRSLSGCSRHNLSLRRFSMRARFIFVTPNTCHDMHDCSVRVGDRWLSRFIPRVTRSAAYRRGRTALFITWDEDDHSSHNHVPMLVVSRSTPAGRRARRPFNHYSALRTWQSMLGMRCLQRSCGARSMRRAFHL